MTENIEKSLLELDFASLTRRTFTPSPTAWEDQVLYFLLLDRFSDGKEKDVDRLQNDPGAIEHQAREVQQKSVAFMRRELGLSTA